MADIKYRYQINNRMGRCLVPNRGTLRSRMGSVGVKPDETYEYDIKVASQDKEQAEYVIKNRR